MFSEVKIYFNNANKTNKNRNGTFQKPNSILSDDTIRILYKEHALILSQTLRQTLGHA